MIVSHRHRFLFFPDPLSGSPALMRGFAPLSDQEVLPENERSDRSPFCVGMSPHEAEWAFDAMGLAYRSYLRIAVVQNPFARLFQLYHRIAATDPFWTARERAGLGRRDFNSWLTGVRPKGLGAGGRTAPRWRRFGAWSAKYWCGPHINHVIRQEHLEDDLAIALAALGVAPSFDASLADRVTAPGWEHAYTAKGIAHVRKHYAWDLAAYDYDDSALRIAS